MRTKIMLSAALLLSTALSLGASSAPAAKCELVTQGDSQVWAKRTKAGNYSTTECEVEISIRYTKPPATAWRRSRPSSSSVRPRAQAL